MRCQERGGTKLCRLREIVAKHGRRRCRISFWKGEIRDKMTHGGEACWNRESSLDLELVGEGQGLEIVWKSKMEVVNLLLIVASSTAFPVLGEEGYSEAGLMGLQLRKVLSRVEARQEESSKKLEELGKMVSEMRAKETVTGLTLGCTTSSGDSVVAGGSEEKERTRDSEVLQVGLESLRASVEASSER